MYVVCGGMSFSGSKYYERSRKNVTHEGMFNLLEGP